MADNIQPQPDNMEPWKKSLIRDFNGRFEGNPTEWMKEAYFIQKMGELVGNPNVGLYGAGIENEIAYFKEHLAPKEFELDSAVKADLGDKVNSLI